MNFIKQYIRRIFLSSASGVLAGVASAIFLISLQWATETRNLHLEIIWALPLAGLFIGWMYFRFGRDIAGGNHLILDEIHSPKKIIPFHMAPFVLIGTLLTHLFGGSAGREGTAVQMGASLSDQLTRYFKVGAEERKILLMAGAGAGFGASIGAPFAGAIFGMEVIYVGRVRLHAWFECLLASFVGFYVAVFLGAPHSHYPAPVIPNLELKKFLLIAVAGVAFGLAAKLFSIMSHFVERTSARFIKYPPLRPFIGGLLLLILFYIEGSYRYVGLGIPFIQQALETQRDFLEPVLKAIFTALTVGTGFKGGEFIPLVYIGTTLGSALASILPISFSLLAAVGFASVFGAAAKTPIACTVMAMEIFGFQVGPYALIGCFVAYFCSGTHGIYFRKFHSPNVHDHK